MNEQAPISKGLISTDLKNELHEALKQWEMLSEKVISQKPHHESKNQKQFEDFQTLLQEVKTKLKDFED